ncbi:F-box domain-containing protein [Artemisia annua]|uniref:F-box domain-containing protein n=1 Tax=Artemisia annua TaxID=35608 RepID=A0A2U1LCX6_ARTAN|nr:F-box domain-containing protein [Artemisia annua]
MPDTNEPIDILYRFGFDPQTDDYKVVKLICRLKQPPYIHPDLAFVTILYVVKDWLPVEVYSMRKGSWEQVTQKVPSHVGRIYDDEEVCGDGHDGHVHWVCELAEMGDQHTILAFDLGLQTFSEISIPADQNDIVFRSFVLGVLGGKLCVMFKVANGDCEVWVLDEYGVAESWVKHHQFSQFRDIDQFGFTLHNEFICAAYNRLAFYDPIAEKVKSSNIRARLLGKGKIVQYMDSLVWIVPPRSEINCCSISSLQI